MIESCAERIHHQFGDFCRFERGVDSTHDVEQRVTASDAASDGALLRAKPARKITVGRRQRDTAGPAELRAALRRSGGAIERDRSAIGPDGPPARGGQTGSPACW